jgi:hypothetical protein
LAGAVFDHVAHRVQPEAVHALINPVLGDFKKLGLDLFIGDVRSGMVLLKAA